MTPSSHRSSAEIVTLFVTVCLENHRFTLHPAPPRAGPRLAFSTVTEDAAVDAGVRGSRSRPTPPRSSSRSQPVTHGSSRLSSRKKHQCVRQEHQPKNRCTDSRSPQQPTAARGPRLPRSPGQDRGLAHASSCCPHAPRRKYRPSLLAHRLGRRNARSWAVSSTASSGANVISFSTIFIHFVAPERIIVTYCFKDNSARPSAKNKRCP